MSPIRLVILALLIYIGYLLIRGTKKTSAGSQGRKADQENLDVGSSNDVLVEDPVCKKLVPKSQAISLTQRGETVYFCSEECCRIFVSQKGEEK